MRQGIRRKNKAFLSLSFRSVGCVIGPLSPSSLLAAVLLLLLLLPRISVIGNGRWTVRQEEGRGGGGGDTLARVGWARLGARHGQRGQNK